jgi:dienelactone hydrolase
MSFDSASRRGELRDWLRLRDPKPAMEFEVLATHAEPSFERLAVTYRSLDGDAIPALLLLPKQMGEPAAAVVVHHQHNGERHFGKSEVCGLAGDPLQAFGPALAERGIVVLAPDSICFEDRRPNAAGTSPHEDDWLQHYNEMTYRLVRGDTLMRKVLEDAEAAVSVLLGLRTVDSSRIGVLGHSYGGNTAMFQSALDERVRFACSSGAVCSYRDKMRRGTGIEMAEVLPGVLERFDVDELLRLAAPRPLLVVSAVRDQYSFDADEIVREAAPAYAAAGAPRALEHCRYEGEHAITRERFDRIVAWLEHVAACEQAVGQEIT